MYIYMYRDIYNYYRIRKTDFNQYQYTIIIVTGSHCINTSSSSSLYLIELNLDF